MQSSPVIIDCDPGHDDAIALWLALAHLDVRAVTTTHGNQTLDRTTQNARPGAAGGTTDVGMTIDHDGFIDLLAAALASHG